MEFIDSSNHPELNELYDTIDAMPYVFGDGDEYCQKRSSILSDMSLDNDYVEINSRDGRAESSATQQDYYLKSPAHDGGKADIWDAYINGRWSWI